MLVSDGRSCPCLAARTLNLCSDRSGGQMVRKKRALPSFPLAPPPKPLHPFSQFIAVPPLSWSKTIPRGRKEARGLWVVVGQWARNPVPPSFLSLPRASSAPAHRYWTCPSLFLCPRPPNLQPWPWHGPSKALLRPSTATAAAGGSARPRASSVSPQSLACVQKGAFAAEVAAA